MKEKIKVIISGGGTGGHIFPAISIANAIRELQPEAEILFVGALGRMEMQRVPDAGYPIIGLPVAGFDRKHLWKNVGVLLKLIKSQLKARKIIKQFKPDIAIGVGGYASGPTLRVAAQMGIPTLIQEQNSYAGVTNKLLAKKALRICVAYEGMEKFFPAEKLILTGNPVRQDLLRYSSSKEEAIKQFGLSPHKETVLIIGGSLGARTINEYMIKQLEAIKHSDVQFIWQTGKGYIQQVREAVEQEKDIDNLYVTDFIQDMASAYAAADLIISRAGAGSISEFCLLRKPVILIPSPNVAEDHQTKNAMALVNKNAALCVKDSEVGDKLMQLIIDMIHSPERLKQLSNNIAQLALPDSANIIAKEAYKLIEEKKKA